MNILVTLNSNYIPPLTVLLKSVFITNPDAFFDIWVAHSSLTDEDFKKISASCDLSRAKIHSVTVDPEILSDAPVLKRLSKETYYRLLAQEILPETVKRVLYIDPDTVVLNKLDELYNTNLGSCLMAAAGHTSGAIEVLNHIRLNMDKNSRYVNAGIILMDLEAMRRFCTVEDIFEFIRLNKKKLYLGDQDVFNSFFTGKIMTVDEYLYNLDEKTFKSAGRKIDLEWVAANCVIVHYNGKYKPWKDGYKGVLDPFWHQINKTQLPLGEQFRRKAMIA